MRVWPHGPDSMHHPLPSGRKRLTAIVGDRKRQRKHIGRAQVILASAGRGPVQQIPAADPRRIDDARH